MAPYLPRDGASSSPYSEGGALFALGLIHAHHGRGIRDFLLESLRATSSEVQGHWLAVCCDPITPYEGPLFPSASGLNTICSRQPC